MTTIALSDRMKRYEQAQALHLTRRVPVIVRVDGRAFHSFTRGCARPYDPWIINSMVVAAQSLAGSMDGCRLAYVQSDEASLLLTDFARPETEAWFAYDLQKVVSLAAAGMTARFAEGYLDPDREMPRHHAEFDARAFNLPREEVANYFLWRARDWHRNSVLMFAQARFSPKQMHGKKLPELHDMLHEIGRNWATDTNPQERNGTFILDGEVLTDVQPIYGSIAPLVEAAMGAPGEPTCPAA
jgi:tRNA(His) 5'-end guanylyltransferase